MKDAVVYDPGTDIFAQREYESFKAKYIIINTGGVIVDPKEFPDFIKNEMGAKENNCNT